MCRICGRTIKCFFENMPSRTLRLHHVPSRRAFTTLRRLPTTPPNLIPSTSSFVLRQPSLTKSFASLSLTPTTRPSLTTSSLTPFTTIQSQAQVRPFSSTPTTLGYRRRMDTYSPSRRVQKRRHGYLARMKTKAGQEVIKRRKLKGRRDLSW